MEPEVRKVRDNAGLLRSSQHSVSARGAFPENLSQLLLPPQPQTHQCKFLIHSYRSLYVNCHLLNEKTVSPQRQRPAEVNTMLTIAGGYSGNEIATLTDDHNALRTATVNELPNMDNFGVVEVVDRPQSQQVLSTRWVSRERLRGSYKVRLVARGFEQTVSSDADFLCRSAKAHSFARTSHDRCKSLRSSRFRRLSQGISSINQSINHQCRVNQNQCMWSKHQGMALQESVSGTRDFSSGLVYSQHTENQRHELQPVEIRSFDVREETCTKDQMIRFSCATWMTWWARNQRNISRALLNTRRPVCI